MVLGQWIGYLKWLQGSFLISILFCAITSSGNSIVNLTLNLYSVFPFYYHIHYLCQHVSLHWFKLNKRTLSWELHVSPLLVTHISALCTARVVTKTTLWAAFNITVVVPLNKLLIHSFVCLSSFLAHSITLTSSEHLLHSLVLILIHNYLFLKS